MASPRTWPALTSLLLVGACRESNPAWHGVDQAPLALDAAAAPRAAFDALGDQGRPADAAAPGLVAHWPFDEGAGTRAADVSGQGNHAPIRAAPAGAWIVGRVGKALDLAVTGPLIVPASPSLNGIASGVTVAGWVRRRSTKLEWAMLASRQVEGTSEEYYGLGLVEDRPTFTTEYFVFSQAPAPAPLDTWIHIAGTYDGATNMVYVDGKPFDAKPTRRRLQPGPTPLIIGGNVNMNSTTPAELLTGAVDDLRIYARALTAPEIAGLAAP